MGILAYKVQYVCPSCQHKLLTTQDSTEYTPTTHKTYCDRCGTQMEPWEVEVDYPLLYSKEFREIQGRGMRLLQSIMWNVYVCLEDLWK